MSSASWMNVLVGFIVGVPIIYVMYRAFRSLRGAEANVWRALPGNAASDFSIVFALEKPLDERAPTQPGDFSAIFITVPGQRAGLTLGPGKYWLYALPAQKGVPESEAANAVAAAVKSNRAAILPFDDLPVFVS